MQPRHQATLRQPLQRDIEIWQNIIEHNRTVRSATTGAKTPSNYAHMNNRFSPTQAPCNIHAAITMRFATMASKAPCHCEAQKHAKHIEPAPTLRTAPSPARTCRTQDVPFIAGYSHFTRKNARFRAPAFSPTQAPCNIHAAITMRFATKFRKHHVIAKRRNRFPRKSTRFRGPASSPTQDPCNIHAAITMRFATKFRKHHVIAKCRNRFPRKNTRFRGPASSPTQDPCNIHAAITLRFATPRTHSCSHYVATSQSQLPIITISNSHHTPFVTTSQVTHSLGQHFPNILAYALFTIIYPHVCCLQCIQMMSHFRPFPCEFWLGHARSRIGCPISLQGYCRRHITKIHQRKQRKAYDHLSKIVV